MNVRDLPDVRKVDVADVYKAGQRAAQLRRTSTGVEFTYVQGYDGPPVATRESTGVHRWCVFTLSGRHRGHRFDATYTSNVQVRAPVET